MEVFGNEKGASGKLDQKKIKMSKNIIMEFYMDIELLVLIILIIIFVVVPVSIIVIKTAVRDGILEAFDILEKEKNDKKIDNDH